MRPMVPSDFKMVCLALEDWPYTEDDGHISPDKVDGYMRRWKQQFNPYVLEVNGKSVGFINYQMRGVFLTITHLAVIPFERGKGYSTLMVEWLRDTLVAEGHETAFFEVLEQSEFILNKFKRHGSGEGKTGRVFYGTTDGNF